MSPGKRNKAGRVTPEPKRNAGGRETLQITGGNDSDGSMPSLEYASDSADSGAAMRGRADESEAESSLDSDGEELSEYDSEEEAELSKLVRKAMDIASARPEMFEEKEAFEQLSNDNHFLKALGALRGKWRCFLI